ncbi:MAG TPA: Ig-like domain-containing protein [Baekduia sp.]|uniref:Ig-like domain-containing protein n=1 Tax=Baekduia sp. TaxID=2600305 RepID=UPI002C91E073|nr:Ig-like domain-containing protein [Baekduia sp.]HMJ36868.1 Ig-like domain-containing protein [Baekduia sp.]
MPFPLNRPVVRLATIVMIAAVAAIFIGLRPSEPHAATAPSAPVGVTAIALDGEVSLSWKSVASATSYVVLRGTTQDAITTQVSPAGLSATTYADATAANGTGYFYVVKAVNEEAPSPASQVVQATPRARTCSSSNKIVNENCFPGTTAWKTLDATRAYDNGIEGFTSASSVDRGGSVDLRVKAGDDTAFHIDIYRTGGYNGAQGRLVSSIRGLTAPYQGPCEEDATGTGVDDCAGWAPATTLTTSADWPTGVYLLKLVRDDNGNANEVLLVVRDDSAASEVLYQVPTTTYQAYNSYSKGLYEWLSAGPNTIAGTSRAVKVSFDRPYSQPVAGSLRNDWYTRADLQAVSWMESQGYDVSYAADEDIDANPALALGHDVLVSGVHDEYWSTQMRNAWKAARDQGTSLFFLGANAAYWRVRFENSGVSGASRRVVVAYKTVQSGPPDPVSSTSTWRDPAGPNDPENSLIGQQYIGDNASNFFPLEVSAAQGKHRLWRYTPAADQVAGGTTSIGTDIVGWEWDSRANNGQEPAGVTTVASSPVTGHLSQNNGASWAPGSGTQMTTIYRASGGGLVFATGTNHWGRGLAPNIDGKGGVNAQVQQATVNVLADMGVTPATPSAAVTIDASGPPQVVSTTPASGAFGVVPNQAIKATFDRELDPSTIDGAAVTLTPEGGSPVAATASLANPSKTITLTPTETLDPFRRYTARIATSVTSWEGVGLVSAYSWSFVTGPGTPPAVTSTTPASAATGVVTDRMITAAFDRRLTASTVTTSSVAVAPTGGGANVAAAVSYDDATRTVQLTPSVRLDESKSYTVTIGTSVQAGDGTPMAAAKTWSFSTGTNLKVTTKTPAPLGTGLSPATPVRAVFSRAADAATVTSANVKLLDPSSNPVPATVAYDGTTRTATLTPSAPLSLMTTYTAIVTNAVRAADGAPIDGTTWTFSTAASPPPAPAVTGISPAAGSSSATNSATIRASFDVAIDPATVTARSFTLTPTGGGTPVAATVIHDPALNRAVLTPLAPLATATGYTATVSTAVRSTTGAPLPADVTWSFTTANCPCSLMSALTPTQTGIPVRDGRGGSGPWTYELGTRLTVASTTTLTALKFYKDAKETGTHIGRVWNSAGTQLTSVTFQNESGSGWQRQALTTPLTLSPGLVYTLSVGLNSYFVNAKSGLAQPLNSGPATTMADGNNGAYNTTAGQFPNQSWNSTNYFVDGVFKLPLAPARTPAVTTRTPTDGATGVARDAKVTATFNYPLNPSTVNGSTVTLKDGATTVAATRAYNDETQTVTLAPTSPLDIGTTYTVMLSTAISSDDDTPMAAPVTWSFTTVPPTPPVATGTSPSSGAANISVYEPVTATFDQAMDASTITTTTFMLAPAGGGSPVAASVSYNATTRTATLTPNAPLSGSTAYTATVTTGARSSRNLALTAPVSWGLTTSACPCRLFSTSDAPSSRGLSTANGRPGGPWSLELGVKIEVTQTARLSAIRFWRDPAETGTHVGRIWTTSGTLLGSVTFSGETASGWQQQALSTPLRLTPGQKYVVSVGYNASFGMTGNSVLRNGIVTGPLKSVVDNSNGVYADAAGTFPTQSWYWGNYFVDAVVE